MTTNTNKPKRSDAPSMEELMCMSVDEWPSASTNAAESGATGDATDGKTVTELMGSGTTPADPAATPAATPDLATDPRMVITSGPVQHDRRRRMIVDGEVQHRIIVNVSWPSAIALALVSLILGVFSMRLLSEAMVAQVELPSLIPMLLTAVGFLVVSAAYQVFHAMKLSHRIAGPAFRLREVLESAKTGDYSARAHLRSSDYLSGVADSLNDLLGELERKAMLETVAADRAAAVAAKTADGAPDGPQGRGESPACSSASAKGEPSLGEQRPSHPTAEPPAPNPSENRE